MQPTPTPTADGSTNFHFDYCCATELTTRYLLGIESPIDNFMSVSPVPQYGDATAEYPASSSGSGFEAAIDYSNDGTSRSTGDTDIFGYFAAVIFGDEYAGKIIITYTCDCPVG